MDSIVTKYDGLCAICGKPAKCTHHMIPGTATRKLCEEDGLKIRLCNSCHNMFLGQRPVGWSCDVHHCPKLDIVVEQEAQLAWEKNFYKNLLDTLGMHHTDEDPAREAFRKRYGKSWL